jgi:hypothetical protein
VTGKSLEDHFQGLGYGWDRDLLRLVLAVLFRGGGLAVTHQDKRYVGSQDPLSRTPFTSATAFRAASFAPRETLDLKTLAAAARRYEELTGEEVDVEESAIAKAFRDIAGEEMKGLAMVEATARAHELPVVDWIEEFKDNLAVIIKCESDEAVRLLAGEGTTFKTGRDRMGRIREALDGRGLERLKKARLLLTRAGPSLEAAGFGESAAEGLAGLKALLEDPEFYEKMESLHEGSEAVMSAYAAVYREVHERRAGEYEKVMEELKGTPAWSEIGEEMQETVMAPLRAKCCKEPSAPGGDLVCGACRSGLAALDGDLKSLATEKVKVIARLQELTNPRREIQYLRISQFFPGAIAGPEGIDEAVEELRQHLHKLVEEGAVVIVVGDHG